MQFLEKIKNVLFNKQIDPFNKENVGDLKLNVTYFDDICIYKNTTFQDIFDCGCEQNTVCECGLSLKLEYKSKILNEDFQMKKAKKEECIDLNYFYKGIRVKEKYRNIGVCSYLLLKSIIVLLENKKNKSFKFQLANTVSGVDIDDSLKIYNRILTECGKGLQYRCFSVENREKDLKELKKMLMQKGDKIIKNITE